MKVGNFNVVSQENHDKFIIGFIETHAKALELVQTTKLIYEVVNLAQLFNTLVLCVTLGFQIQSSVFIILLTAIILQLFAYCFLGECISSKVRKTSLNSFSGSCALLHLYYFLKIFSIWEFSVKVLFLYFPFPVWKAPQFSLLLKMVRNFQPQN